MSELSDFLGAVAEMASSQSGGAAKLKKLVEDKYVVPTMAAIKTLSEWSRCREAFGEIEFRQYLHKVAEPKLRALARRFDKHSLLTAESSAHDVRLHLEELAAGSVAPAAAPQKPRKKVAVVVPDLREAYRSGGNDRVFEVIAPLDAKALKAVVQAQELKADVVPGRTVDGLRKFIQVALKGELGPRGDAIGELSRMKPEFDGD